MLTQLQSRLIYRQLLGYMDVKNGEFIRFKNDVEDYYIYKETQNALQLWAVSVN